ncbi:hypothetical protein [Thalassoroseus pseudoceratinae]|uniref:hypothetical protein n=1 Tax=Thalassoroseus pseudoceratinae TaxID=2713176 RepID=UPI0014235927|nr:hypothetical protein [Thalassoroseus pseudoceratinae]
MSSLHYKTLLANLPSMAAVVNSFESPDVQRAVFDVLIDSFQKRLASERTSSSSTPDATPPVRSSNGKSSEEVADLTHDLVDGESIHSFSSD